MKPHQERVIQERDDLEARINRLHEFILFGTTKYNVILPDSEMCRLRMQLRVMELYLTILDERIENFPVE